MGLIARLVLGNRIFVKQFAETIDEIKVLYINRLLLVCINLIWILVALHFLF